MYLGGCNIDNENSCLKIVNRIFSPVHGLEYFYNKAYNRLMYHLNHAVKCTHAEAVHILTGDTDIFVNLMYNFSNWSIMGWKKFGLTN